MFIFIIIIINIIISFKGIKHEKNENFIVVTTNIIINPCLEKIEIFIYLFDLHLKNIGKFINIIINYYIIIS